MTEGAPRLPEWIVWVFPFLFGPLAGAATVVLWYTGLGAVRAVQWVRRSRGPVYAALGFVLVGAGLSGVQRALPPGRVECWAQAPPEVHARTAAFNEARWAEYAAAGVPAWTWPAFLTLAVAGLGLVCRGFYWVLEADRPDAVARAARAARAKKAAEATGSAV